MERQKEIISDLKVVFEFVDTFGPRHVLFFA